MFMCVAAYPAIRIVFGVQWLEAVPLSQVLCFAGAVELIYMLLSVKSASDVIEICE